MTSRLSDDVLLSRYARPVPRYTSYPTALHFEPLPDTDLYAESLAALEPGTELSLYLHVPFCHALCAFCGCHTTVVHKPAAIAAYAASLRAEIALLARAVGRRVAVRHLHWGGGTPTTLGPADLAATMRTLTRHFPLADGAEVAVEIDPRTLDTEITAALREIGVNRASLGVQDFDPQVQQAVHRIQSFDLVAEAVAALRGAGVAGINFDLMYGLPYQSEASVVEAAQRALELAPDRFAAFGYAHVPWVKRHQNLLPAAALPDLRARHRQQRAIARVLTEAGYVAIGLDHFARPGDALATAAATGRLHRNFQGYTTDAATTLLGVGASAISSLPDAYVQNAPSVPEWRAGVRAGRLPVVRGVRLSAEDRLRRDVIERIMCDFAVDLAAAARKHGAALKPLLSPDLAGFAADGLIGWDGCRLEVTAIGRPFLRTIAAAFDERSRTAVKPNRYSQAI